MGIGRFLFPAGARADTAFCKRFEADGDSYLFRAKPSSQPVRITRDEYAAFLAQFKSGRRWLSALLFLFVVALATAFALLPDHVSRNLQTRDRVMEVLIWIAMAFFMAGWFWIWREPTRALEGRRTIGPARTKDEIRLAHFKGLGFRQFSTMCFGALIMLLQLDDGGLSLNNILFGAGFLLIVGAMVVILVRKFRLRRD